MLELGISQAQTQFTKLLNQTVVIVDNKAVSLNLLGFWIMMLSKWA